MDTEMDSRPNHVNVEYINFEQEDSPSLMRTKADSVNLEVDCNSGYEPAIYPNRATHGGLN